MSALSGTLAPGVRVGFGRVVLFGLLLVVAAAAAVLSFTALRDLAAICGFAQRLAWLLPVVVDAGAAAGSLVWLGGHVAEAARRFARALALALLGLSVAANALGHILEAFELNPPWWVVVAVSAIAPTVLGAVVHLAVLVGRTAPNPATPLDGPPEAFTEAFTEAAPEPGEEAPFYDGELVDGEHTEHYEARAESRWWRDAPPVAAASGPDRAEALIAAGVGRRRLSRELDISEYEARQLLARSRTSTSTSTEDVATPESGASAPAAEFDPRTSEHISEQFSSAAVAVGNQAGDRS